MDAFPSKSKLQCSRMSKNTPQQVVIPSDTLAARAIQLRIVEMLEALDYPNPDVLGVRLALEEVLMNAIKHGNKMDPAKVVRIEYQITNEEIAIEIEDQGDGFCPADVPDPTLPENLERPGGRGVFLIHTFMSSVEYNLRGNLVRMKKTRTHVNCETLPAKAPVSRRLK
jgi:serine/threonine-protein kinase RsbW